MCLEALKSVGFEVLEYSDLADSKSNPLVASAQEPWHSPLKGPKLTSLSSLLSLENVRIIFLLRISFYGDSCLDSRCIHGEDL